MIDLTSYQEQDFSGLFGSQSEGNDLLKAMQAGAITGRDTTNQLLTQEPLKIESLDKTLKLLEFRMKDVKLWNAIPKQVAYNTVEEFIQLESYGTDRGGFYGEGELSDVEDSKYRRKAELVKYIQVTGEVTLQAQVVRSYVAAMEKEVANKSMWVIRKVSSALTKADSSVIGKEFNGLYAQHQSIGSGANGELYLTLDEYQDSTAVIDLRGNPLTQSNIATSATNVDNNFGNVDTLFAPPTVLDGLAKDYYSRQRILQDGTPLSGVIGTVPKGIDTQFGTVNMFQDKFMKKTPARRIGDASTSPKAPSAPTVSNQALAADVLSRFKAGEIHTGALGAVFYAVAAVNEYGESPITVFNNTTKITLTAAQSVDLTFTATAGAYSPSGYVIYRSKITTSVNATTDKILFYPLFKVSTAQLAAGYDGAAALSVRDRNRFLPDTEEGFTTEMVDDVLAFKQLMPISKLDLAVVAPANRFITFLWGTPQIYTPKKMVRFINVGPFIG